jgi:WD40 repeat protein
MNSKGVELNNTVLQSFKVARVHKENLNAINSLDFDDQGSLLLTSSEDESMRVYSCNSGEYYIFNQK